VNLIKSKKVLLVLIYLIFSHNYVKSQIGYESAFPNISFNNPVEIQNAGDGTNRLFVIEQPGDIKVFPNSSTVTNTQVKTFLNIQSKVFYNSGEERGLLGLAFHPNYSNNGYFYVYYTRESATSSGGDVVLERYSVSSSDPNIANTSSGQVLFSFTKNQIHSNHNGGKIAFGPDGYLYISIGDGGGGGDPSGNGQNLNTAFGSILRIDVDKRAGNPLSANNMYAYPTDNPRLGISGLDELYAWGIRNTWKFSFDTLTGRLWGADVGQEAFEEINLITKGGNYGWDHYEGNLPTAFPSGSLATTPAINPVYFYNHNNGDQSITGGYVYRGSITDATLNGNYVYGDFLTGRVWSLDYNPATGTGTPTLLFQTNGIPVSSFGLDESGELYFSGYGGSAKIYKITGTTSGPTNITVNGVGNWSNLYSGTNGIVETIAEAPDGKLYVGGEFTTAGGISANNIAVFDPNLGWSNFGSGTNGKVNNIAITTTGLIYVGGEFSIIGGVSAANIGVWNGSNWSGLGTGTNGPISKLILDQNNNLYAGGTFVTAGGTTVDNIAFWSNTTWTALTDASTGVTGTNNEIRALAIENNLLYVGGNFGSAGGKSANRIATWNASTNTWGTLGAGTSGFVQAIKITPTTIFAGGNFGEAAGQTVNRIAQWNRSTQTWSSLDFGLSGSVNALEHDGTYLYAGGVFETASDVLNQNKIVKNIVRWSDANGWQALGTNSSVGTNNVIYSLLFTENNSKLYVGGNFTSSGAITSSNRMAVWGTNLSCINKITPKYTVNGIAANGNTNVTVNQGDEVTLGVVQDGVSFTISFGGNSVNGNLGSVSLSQSGTYSYSTTQGCVATLTLSVTPTPDADNDGVSDANDICPNTPAGQTVNTNGCAQSQLDDDNDGVFNNVDTCPNTPLGETVNGVGCSDSQIDDDNDGVFNNLDICPNTPIGDVVSTSGCSDNQLDDDNDGIVNSIDTCANTPLGETVNTHGCSDSQLDDDNDGINNNLDLCPNTPNNTTVNANGCGANELDDDNDGVSNNIDQCPNTPNGATVDSFGCQATETDGDNDGVLNANDLCPNTPTGATVDSDGCSASQLDDDNDGVPNSLDLCANTPSGATVNTNGCAQSQLDSDNDGVKNNNDLCPNTPAGQAVNSNGCAQSQLDNDNDGVPNGTDQCPSTPAGQTVNANGCAQSQLDDDNDGVRNNLDTCPNTPTGQTVNVNGCAQSQLDDDGDGVTNNLDQCPNTPSGSNVDAQGCVVTVIPNTNFQISSSSVNCNGGNTGEISIQAENTYTYSALLTGTSSSNSYSFTNNLDITALAAGTYELCLTIAEVPNYVNCSTIIISEPELLSVQIELNGLDNSINLVLSGSVSYKVNVNGITFTTQEQQITIPGTNEKTTIVVSTDLPCQGIFEEIILFPNSSFVYPNPFENEVTVFLGSNYSETAELSLFSATGELIDTQFTTIENGEVTYYPKVLSSGLYYLNVTIGKENMVFKVIKK
tara:strand:+ start:20210 stop:24661 length:4452 start_codon:yes stop_codon:yes gene_type:complete